MACSGVALQLSTGAKFQRAPVRQRCRQLRAVVVAGELTPDQLQGAIQRQLNKSAQKAPAPAQPAPASAAPEDDIKQRQAEARAWIQPWLDAQQSKRSKEIQDQVRERVSLISTDLEQQALKRLLFGGSGSYEEEEAATAAPAAQAEPAKPAAGAGAVVFEDGSLLFTSEMLQAVNYEDVLTA